MTYEEGLKLLEQLHSEEPSAPLHSKSFFYKGFEIRYPGRKKLGDYALVYNGRCPTHEDCARWLFRITSEENFEELVRALEDIHANGDSASNTFFPESVKTFIFLITLQEESNYPSPANGRTLTFWRFYEAALAKLGFTSIEDVVDRTNNHRSGVPALFEGIKHYKPAYYIKA